MHLPGVTGSVGSEGGDLTSLVSTDLKLDSVIGHARDVKVQSRAGKAIEASTFTAPLL